jgi:hypothetical protein
VTENDYIEELKNRWPRTTETKAALETVALADEATRAFPGSPKLWCMRGNLIELGPENSPHGLDEALASYERAIEVDPLSRHRSPQPRSSLIQLSNLNQFSLSFRTFTVGQPLSHPPPHTCAHENDSTLETKINNNEKMKTVIKNGAQLLRPPLGLFKVQGSRFRVQSSMFSCRVSEVPISFIGIQQLPKAPDQIRLYATKSE